MCSKMRVSVRMIDVFENEIRCQDERCVRKLTLHLRPLLATYVYADVRCKSLFIELWPLKRGSERNLSWVVYTEWLCVRVCIRMIVCACA